MLYKFTEETVDHIVNLGGGPIFFFCEQLGNRANFASGTRNLSFVSYVGLRNALIFPKFSAETLFYHTKNSVCRPTIFVYFFCRGK